MNKRLVLIAGLVLLGVGYWLIGPLWHMTMRPPNHSLPGNGSADWEQYVSSAELALATLGVGFVWLSGLLMLLGWGRASRAPAEPGLARALLEPLRAAGAVVLALAVCMPGSLFALFIAGHQLHWTHVQSDQATHLLAAVAVAAVGVFLAVAMILDVAAWRRRGDARLPGSGFDLAAMLILFLTLLVPIAVIAMIYAAPALPIDRAAGEIISTVLLVLVRHPYLWFAGAMAVYVALRGLGGQAAKRRASLERAPVKAPGTLSEPRSQDEPLGAGAQAAVAWNLPAEIIATRTRSVVGAIVAVALTAAFYVLFDRQRDLWVLCAAAFFAATALVLIIKAILPDRLRISASGFRYDTFRGTVVDAPWSEIGKFRLWRYSSAATFILFDVSAKVRPSVRFQTGNTAMANADITITASWPMAASQLVAQLNGARDRWGDQR